eukprot:gnl/Hemi2/23789_TR7981_c0_g1_i1.p2 gnl/Hemi2/23789_TR7981_c0_g1~~gnl/Hemi2/23789_TR7981_c0_g1_i1.p2  ORF type:complete len:251 (-),score=74.95 gnl/Hemi2/23789_TR7981_c0_g1_i1:105-857(-)
MATATTTPRHQQSNTSPRVGSAHRSSARDPSSQHDKAAPPATTNFAKKKQQDALVRSYIDTLNQILRGFNPHADLITDPEMRVPTSASSTVVHKKKDGDEIPPAFHSGSLLDKLRGFDDNLSPNIPDTQEAVRDEQQVRNALSLPGRSKSPGRLAVLFGTVPAARPITPGRRSGTPPRSLNASTLSVSSTPRTPLSSARTYSSSSARKTPTSSRPQSSRTPSKGTSSTHTTGYSRSASSSPGRGGGPGAR